MLELKHITYTVSTPEGEQTILNDISIDIPDRKLIVFTGPNGGGKTTLAKVIMGLVTPTGGQILFNGQDITHLGITERAKLGISYGFQQPPRFKGITVRNLLTIASGAPDRDLRAAAPSGNGHDDHHLPPGAHHPAGRRDHRRQRRRAEASRQHQGNFPAHHGGHAGLLPGAEQVRR